MDIDISYNDKIYKPAGKREGITMADSFVAQANKTGGGNGEAKLYIGNEDPSLRAFYGSRGFVNKCFFSRENLTKYLYDAKNEYFSPTQPYRKQAIMAELWQKRFTKVEEQPEWIPFTIEEQDQIRPPRIYTKSPDKPFLLMRELALPNFSTLTINRYESEDGDTIFIYTLHFKYPETRSGNDQEEENEEEDEQPATPANYNFSEMMNSLFGEEDAVYHTENDTDNNTEEEKEDSFPEEESEENDEETEEDSFFPVMAVEEEPEEHQQPYDTEKISIEKKSTSMDACIRRMEQGTIILNPDFQRNEVWNMSKKSRLIESLMLKIPIPMFYVSADERGNYTVVDGLQRLSTIRDFVLGKNYLDGNAEQKGSGFQLTDLEFWGEKYNGATFNDLPVEMQNRILETEFIFTVINPGTPEEVKRNVFKRLNTGGEPLTPQEIRNALYTGKSTLFLNKLAASAEFRRSTYEAVKSERMVDKELILRAIAFIVRSYESYPRSSDMDKFLSDTMCILNQLPAINSEKNPDVLIADIEELETRFRNGQLRAWKLFGKHTFRKSYGKKRRTPINKALFEVWTVLLGSLTTDEYNTLLENRRTFLKEYNEYLEDNNFNYIISRDSLKFTSVERRYNLLSDLIMKHL